MLVGRMNFEVAEDDVMVLTPRVEETSNRLQAEQDE
jgi:hypothetical protein